MIWGTSSKLLVTIKSTLYQAINVKYAIFNKYEFIFLPEIRHYDSFRLRYAIFVFFVLGALYLEAKAYVHTQIS